MRRAPRRATLDEAEQMFAPAAVNARESASVPTFIFLPRREHMRKVALFCTALVLGALGIAAVAFGIQGRQSVSVALQNARAGSGAGNMTVTLGTSIVAGEKPWAAKRAVVHFDRNLVFSPRGFATCSVAQVRQDDSKCPSASRIGSGSAQATMFSGRKRTADVTPVITAYNGSRSASHMTIYLLVVERRFNVRDVMVGSMRADHGAYGRKLDVRIPRKLQTGGLPNVMISITTFRTSVGGTRGHHSYVSLKGCSGGRLRFKGAVSFTDGSTRTGTSTSACRR
jgi:hypothetical protein